MLGLRDTTNKKDMIMTTIGKIILALVAAILLLFVVLGALWAAIQEIRWRKSKSDKHDMYNQD